jgi:hypothetical protein
MTAAHAGAAPEREALAAAERGAESLILGSADIFAYLCCLAP